MSIQDDIANRHLLPADGLNAMPQSESQFVRIVVPEEWAHSRAGQLLVCCLVNQLVRQVRLVREIEIISPRTPSLLRVPLGISLEDFPACLLPLSAWAVDGAVTLSSNSSTSEADHTIYVGGPPPALIPPHQRALVVLGDGWRAWAGDPASAPQGVAPSSRTPLGPLLAAAMAAGEVFKRNRGILRGRYLTADGISLWSGRAASDWHSLEEGPAIAGHSLRPVHVAGVGAVGNALAYIVAYLELAESYLILIDDDQYDTANLNRCLLAGWQHRDSRKVNAVADALRVAGVGAYPFFGSVNSYIADPRLGLRQDVARQVDDLDFEIVASCVDKGLSRQHIQGLRPRLLAGGSTFNLQAKGHLYSGIPGAACLACFNRAERDGEKIRALESQLRTMAPEERTRFLEGNGLDAEAIDDYLAGARCGALGEAAIREFAIRVPPQFSAGFVSLGAGLLLAATIVRNAIFKSSAPRLKDLITLNFLNGRMIDSGFGADENCELHCQAKISR
jgi:hypothetical protein